MAEHLDGHLFGDQSPCFGCAPHHPNGLKLKFTRDEDRVLTLFTPGEQYQGPPGIMHGGLVATVADELAAWTIVALKKRMGFTAAFDARLHQPLRIGEEVTGCGRITNDSRRIVRVLIEMSQYGELAFVGNFTFALFDKSGAEKLLRRQLPEAWQQFCR